MLRKSYSEKEEKFIELYNKINELYSKVNEHYNDLNELFGKINELYSKANEISSKVNDIQIRNHDIQDRVYDIIYQLRIKDAHDQLRFWELYRKEGESIEDTKARFFYSLSKPSDNDPLRKMQKAVKHLLDVLNEICKENNLTYWIDFGTLLGAIRHKGFIPWDDDLDVCMPREDMNKLEEILNDNPDYMIRRGYYTTDKHNLNHVAQLKYRLALDKSIKYCLDIFIMDYCSDSSRKNWEKQDEIRQNWVSEGLTMISQKELTISETKVLGDTDCLDELFDEFQMRAVNEVGITEEKNESVIWGLDNFTCKYSFQGNHPVSEIFPLIDLEFEGNFYKAPRKPKVYLSEKYGDIYTLPNDILSHKHFILNDEEKKSLDELILKFEL